MTPDTDSQVEEENNSDPQESEGDGEPTDIPILPNGEWYMPDLRSTRMTEVLQKGTPHDGDNSGRILINFPRLKNYTKSEFYLVNPSTGEIDLYNPATSQCVAFPIKATREPVDNSVIITAIRAFMREHNEKYWRETYIPGADIQAPTDTPYSITVLGEIMTIYEEVCNKQASINLEIFRLKEGNDREKWLELGYRNIVSERIREQLTKIYSILAIDAALRATLGKSTYKVPSFDPHSVVIKNRESISNLCRLVGDIVGEIMDKASTFTSISTNIPPPVVNIVENVNDTPTNTGSSTASAVRRVAFGDQPDINDRLIQISTSSNEDAQGRTGRPQGVPEGSWRQYPSPNSVSSSNSNDNVRCYKCGILGHYSNQCSKAAWCSNCNMDNHSTEHFLKTRPITSSTPRPPTQEISQVNTNNTSMQSSNDLLQTKLEQDAKTKIRKYRMRKIAEYDGKNKERCLTWIESNRTAAKEVNISLRDALLDTASDVVYEVVAAMDHDISDRELTQHLLETFSDIQTPEDAIRKLKHIRRGTEPLVTFNNKYTAIHLIAYSIDPTQQMIERTWRIYANTLDKDLARHLNKFITYQMDKEFNRREIHSLHDVMKKVQKLETQHKKHKQYSDEKEEMDSTQIKEEVNEVEYGEVNEINGRFQPKFNSTMSQRNNNYSSHSSGYHGSPNNTRNSNFYQNRHSPNTSRYASSFRQNSSQNTTKRPDRPRDTTRFSGSTSERQVDQVGTSGNSFSQDRSFNNRYPGR